MTLGVIDEFRKHGIGTVLLYETYEHVIHNYSYCNIVYLHVVCYNHSGINFYTQKNGFVICKKEINHYVIFDKEFDALLLYIVLDRQPDKKGIQKWVLDDE